MMKKLVRAIRGETLPNMEVKYLLHKAMSGLEKKRDPAVIHASDLTNENTPYCSRKQVLAYRHGLWGNQFIGTSQRYTFDNGRAMEWYFNNVWARDNVIGKWECPTCNVITHGFYWSSPCSDTCVDPEKRKHRPFVFECPETGISGEADSLVSSTPNTGGKLFVKLVELKTMAADAWSKLKAPLSEHTIRTRIYLYLMEKDKDTLDMLFAPDKAWWHEVMFDQASIVYMCRGYGTKDTFAADNKLSDLPFSPFKEFIIKQDLGSIQPYLKAAKITKEFLKKDIPVIGLDEALPDGICPSPYCKEAQSCHLHTLCFK